MGSTRSITLGSDYVKQTSGAGMLRTDFDRALSALRSQISAKSPSADRARYLAASEAFLKAYVEASEKLGRSYKAPASTDFVIKNAIIAGGVIDAPTAILLAGWFYEAYSAGKVPLSMWNPAAYLTANPTAKDSIYGAAKSVVGTVKTGILDTVASAAKLPFEAAGAVAKPLVGSVVTLVGAGVLAWLLLRRNR